MAAAAAALVLAGCSSSSTSTSSTSASASASSAITVADAYVVEPTLPEKTAFFAVITNGGASEVSLTGASVPAEYASAAQVHETVMVDGAMSMQEVASVPVPAGGELALKSGGYHVMLMNPQGITAGGTVPVTLTFSDGTSVTTDAPVKAPEPMASGSSMPSASPSM